MRFLQSSARSILPGIIFLLAFSSCSKKEIPVLTTETVSSITIMSAKSGGNITDDGGADITERGVCYNTSGNPTKLNQRTSNGTGTGTFVSNAMYLNPDTYYYLRAYATNKAGTGYGDVKEFHTPPLTKGTVTDVEGNIYGTVVLGNQTWMTENLRTTKYNDNTPISLVRNNDVWTRLITPAYCWYDNDSLANKAAYGAIYNWYVISTGKLCPDGWRVPINNDWNNLSNYLGGEYLAGDKLKEEGGSHWINFSTASTNVSGFTARPGGGRIDGNFVYKGFAGAWWTSTEYDKDNAWCRELDDDIVELLTGAVGKSFGFSVRCIKN
ncbi:MAG TPA: fibrobacter succinogenes major paralogous domain-containing protein [Bacteroidales bacterium]|nr:fibrobacter succinogenes major paralogous domain-containing protein [Bacteroidales bacterium]